MPDRRAARARLFLPFDALDGFRDHLAAKERPQESRKLLSEDDHVRIDHTRAIWRASCGMRRGGISLSEG